MPDSSKKITAIPQIIIEEDNFEEGLVDTLIEAGIKKEDIVIS